MYDVTGNEVFQYEVQEGGGTVEHYVRGDAKWKQTHVAPKLSSFLLGISRPFQLFLYRRSRIYPLFPVKRSRHNRQYCCGPMLLLLS